MKIASLPAIATAIAASLLAACATPPSPTYVKSGATSQQLARDKAQCTVMAGVGNGNMNRMHAEAEATMFHNCMIGLGWKKD